ncbi:MAG: SCP2 sterol-binding domain-containing protein [Anaerolineae bacterium]|jgi:putative sterol carrier protein|nr:SCP2 sterol-binding domain-containing protein [Chloroflexota bacterium]
MAVYANREELIAILDQVVAELNKNETLTTRIRSANVSLGINVTDLPGTEYVIAFSKGVITGTAGSASAATVGITLASDTLDRIFLGRLSGESAYFSGALRLRGDEWMAESVANYIYYITPLYKAATEHLSRD